MNICIEGPDNSGKSTLVKELAYIYDRPVIHATRPESDEHAWGLFQDETQDSGSAILDRSQAMSGIIYDVVVRKQLPLFGREHVERLAECTLLIVCLPPKEVVLADNGREQMDGVVSNHEALYDAYTELANGGKIGHCSVFIYDYTKHKPTDVMDWIEDLLGGPLY